MMFMIISIHHRLSYCACTCILLDNKKESSVTINTQMMNSGENRVLCVAFFIENTKQKKKGKQNVRKERNASILLNR